MAGVQTGFFKASMVLSAALSFAALLVCGTPAWASSRIKDIADFEGVRDNHLIGYGLVVGLLGTGDSLQNTPFTGQSLQAMMDRMGVHAEHFGDSTGRVDALDLT